MDGGAVTYVVGLNSRQELQHVYWGKRLYRDADLTAVQPTRDWASFDLSTTTTPQEYPGWGAGLYTEPGLKITFPDGNRDLVLHYVSHRIQGSTLEIQLKD